MKKNYVAILIILSSFFCNQPLFAKQGTDSSAVYFTQEQFDTDARQLSCGCRIKEKAYPLWSDFNFEASGVLSIKDKDASRKIFEPGTIYGFIMNGIRYKYIISKRKYFAVLKDERPIVFFAREKSDSNEDFYKNGFILYCTSDSNIIKPFTKKNIAADLKTNPAFPAKMIELTAVLKKYMGNLSRKDFFKCQQIINQYF